MSRVYNLVHDETDRRDEIYVDFNKYYDIIEWLIHHYIMETTGDPIPANTKEYIEYFLKLEDIVKYWKKRKGYNFA